MINLTDERKILLMNGDDGLARFHARLGSERKTKFVRQLFERRELNRVAVESVVLRATVEHGLVVFLFNINISIN